MPCIQLAEHYEVTFRRPPVIDDMGDGIIVFSTDWLHGGLEVSHAVAAFMTLPISEKSKPKIRSDNCARYDGIATD